MRGERPFAAIAATMLVACAGSASAPPSTHVAAPATSAPPPSTAAPVPVTRLTLALTAATDVEGVHLTLGDVSLPNENWVGFVTLYPGELDSFHVYEGGCARAPFGEIAIEHLDEGPGPWARLAWVPWSSEVDLGDGAEHVVAPSVPLVGLGWRVRVIGVEPRRDGSTLVRVSVQRPDWNEGSEAQYELVPATGGHAEQAVGEHVLSVTLARTRDALGCPEVGLTLIDPHAQRVVVEEGGTASLRVGAQMVLGATSIRWMGNGEVRRTDGDVATLFFQTHTGDAPEESTMCPMDQPCVVSGVAIDLVALGEPLTTFRVHTAPTPPR